MELNFNQMTSLIEVLKDLQGKTLPFKLSLILAKNMNILDKEFEFYIEQEKMFANKYLEVDENGNFIQERDNVFKIKSDLIDECKAAREELNNFTSNVDLRKIPMSLLENLDFTPKQLLALELIIDEEA